MDIRAPYKTRIIIIIRSISYLFPFPFFFYFLTLRSTGGRAWPPCAPHPLAPPVVLTWFHGTIDDPNHIVRGSDLPRCVNAHLDFSVTKSRKHCQDNCSGNIQWHDMLLLLSDYSLNTSGPYLGQFSTSNPIQILCGFMDIVMALNQNAM